MKKLTESGLLSFLRLQVKIFLLLIIGFTGIDIFLNSLSYFTPDFSRGYLMDKESVFEGVFSIGLYTHIISAPLLLLLASIQVFRKKRSDRFHRVTGSIYVVGVLLIGGPSGVVLSFYAFGGLWAQAGLLLLSVLWMISTVWSYQSASTGCLVTHRYMSVGSYLLLCSAILLRVFSFIATRYLDLPPGEILYTCIVWLSWLPSVVILGTVWFFSRNVVSRI